MVNYAEVLRLIADETKRNILSYTAFNIDQTQKHVLDEMERYINYKIYDSKYGDMVPLIAPTALSLKDSRIQGFYYRFRTTGPYKRPSGQKHLISMAYTIT